MFDKHDEGRPLSIKQKADQELKHYLDEEFPAIDDTHALKRNTTVDSPLLQRSLRSCYVFQQQVWLQKDSSQQLVMLLTLREHA